MSSSRITPGGQQYARCRAPTHPRLPFTPALAPLHPGARRAARPGVGRSRPWTGALPTAAAEQPDSPAAAQAPRPAATAATAAASATAAAAAAGRAARTAAAAVSAGAAAAAAVRATAVAVWGPATGGAGGISWLCKRSASARRPCGSACPRLCSLQLISRARPQAMRQPRPSPMGPRRGQRCTPLTLGRGRPSPGRGERG